MPGGPGTQPARPRLCPCGHHSVITTAFPRTNLCVHQGNRTAQTPKATTYTKDFIFFLLCCILPKCLRILQDRIRGKQHLFYLFPSLKEEGFEVLWRIPPSRPSSTVPAETCVTICAEGEQTPVREMLLHFRKCHLFNFFRLYV